jgi:hypothetical protein
MTLAALQAARESLSDVFKSEALIKTFQGCCDIISDLSNSTAIFAQVGAWLEVYNSHHPRSAHRMKSPRKFYSFLG